MVDYFQEFREFVNFTKCKILANGFNRSHSKNIMKLGIFLNNTEVRHPQFRKWLQIYHKCCKKSKTLNFSNSYLLSFQMKLAKISKKLTNEAVITKNESNKLLIDAFNKSDKEFNYGKLRKLMFVKKISRHLPLEIKKLSTDISFYISESVNEKEIDASFLDVYDEVITVKRKRFARQIKETLVKYYNDFSSFCKNENDLDKQENSEDELKELNKCLSDFDTNVFVYKSANNVEILNKSDNIPFHFDVNTSEHAVNELGNSSLFTEVTDFNDFDVVDEWDDCANNEISTNNVVNNFTDQLVSSLAEINNNILDNLSSNDKLSYSVNNLVEIYCNLDNYPGNRTISNLQESFLLNFVNNLDKIILKIKCNDREIENKNEIGENLLCNQKSYSKPKPVIKIMNLKKPYAYLSIENAMNNKSNEINLENIPLPIKSHGKSNNGENLPNKNANHNIVHSCKEPNIEDRSDILDDEMIPQSILDFSEVLNDEFDGKENADLHLDINISPALTVNDNCSEKLPENRLIILKESNKIENHCKIDDNEVHSDQNIIENYKEIDYNVESECNYCENIFDAKHNRPDNNYSIFSIDENYNNTDFRPHYSSTQYDEYSYDNEDFDNYYSSNRKTSNNYNFRNNTMNINSNNNNNNNNINNYRHYDRGNRRLFRNFLRYTCQSNNNERRWLNESQRF